MEVSFGLTKTTCGVRAEITKPSGMAAARTFTIFFQGPPGLKVEQQKAIETPSKDTCVDLGRTHASVRGGANDDDDAREGEDVSQVVRVEGISHTRLSRKIPMRASLLAVMIQRGHNRKCTDVWVND